MKKARNWKTRLCVGVIALGAASGVLGLFRIRGGDGHHAPAARTTMRCSTASPGRMGSPMPELGSERGTVPADVLVEAGAASVPVAVPDRQGMDTLAKRVGRELFGEGAALFESQQQIGPRGRPMSYLYIFTVGGPVESKEEILQQLAAGVDPIRWDGRVRCLEMGATEDLPPVGCYWNGLPPEYLFQHEAQEKLRAEFGDRPYKLVTRHLTAAFPVLEFRAGSESYFYQPSSGRAGQDFRVRERQVPDDAKGRERLAAIRVSWQRFLERMAH